jgi:uncharacterized protein YdaT
MPWTAKSAKRHSKAAAKSPRRRRAWAATANSALKRGASEGSAIRQANAAAKRVRKKRRKR